jgi:Fe2+ or Zn2+ uptake regulation protein
MTNQRLVILEHLQETDQHPTVEKIYRDVKTKLPKLSKATVYRNLNDLEKEGVVSKLIVGKQSRWEAGGEPHHHFICNNCKRIIEVKLADIWQLKERIESKYNVEVDEYQLIAKGKCDFCERH